MQTKPDLQLWCNGLSVVACLMAIVDCVVNGPGLIGRLALLAAFILSVVAGVAGFRAERKLRTQ